MRSTLFGIIASGVAFDADAQAFFTAASITDDTQKTAVNDLVVALKADGIWAKCNAIYPFVGGTASTHKYNLKDPQDTNGAYRLTFSGTNTHDAEGYTGSTSDGYARTYLVPNSVLSATSHHMAIYLRGAGSASWDSREMGAYSSATATMMLRARSGGNTARAYSLREAAGVISVANSDATGFWVMSRRANNDFELYKNGSSFGTDTNTNTGTLPTHEIYLSAVNVTDSSPSGNGANEIAFASIGAGLDDTEASNYHTAVEAFQDALSRGVVA